MWKRALISHNDWIEESAEEDGALKKKMRTGQIPEKEIPESRVAREQYDAWKRQEKADEMELNKANEEIRLLEERRCGLTTTITLYMRNLKKGRPI